MHIPVTEDVADLKNSDYFCRHYSDGSVRPSRIPFSLVFRSDAEPTHDIFYDKFFKIIYCTDEFALRVLKAGCSGVFFLVRPIPAAMTHGCVRCAASRRSPNGPAKSSAPN